MSYEGIFENLVRVAIIESVDYDQQQCVIRLHDRVNGQTFTAALPNPSSGTDSGVFHHPEPGTIVAVGWSYREQPVILTTLPSPVFSQDFTEPGAATDIATGVTGYPSLSRGEVALAGSGGTELRLTNHGSINMTFGSSIFDLDCSNTSVLRVEDSVSYTESQFKTSGIIFRDLREVTSKGESLEDKLTNLSYIRNLTPISRDPLFAPVSITSSLKDGLSEAQRNPPFVESKTITYEFAQSYMVDTLDEEALRLNENEELDFLNQPNNRNNVRYNILNLNPDNPNVLSEKVEGTLVDIYGNILDLNRSPILFPGDTEGRKSTIDRLKKLEALSRRSIKLHYELNSRKQASGQVSTRSLEGGGGDIDIGHNHSRWSVDVDGEGLTKINIPASSNSGNIPLLSRYVTANLRAKDSTEESSAQNSSSSSENSNNNDASDPRDIFFRPKSITGVDTNQDIFHLAFGDFSNDGVPVDFAPGNIGEEGGAKLAYRTAYHDIINTAPDALTGLPTSGAEAQSPFSPDVEIDPDSQASFQDAVDAALASPLAAAAGPPVPATPLMAMRNTPLINHAGEGVIQNAGGRSLSSNLDGSLELNIGRDVVDNKSVVIDTSGGIISRIGKTKEAEAGIVGHASVISQLDGSIYIQVGGDAVGEEDKVVDPTVRLAVHGSKGTDEIMISEECVLVRTASGSKSIMLDSSKDIILRASGTILLAGSTVAVGGSVDNNGGNIVPARLIATKGKEI